MTTKSQIEEQNWILRRPLQIESLRQELPESEEVEELLRKLQHRKENLDAVIYALTSKNLASDRREYLIEILRRHQQSLEECFQELGVSFRSQGHAPLWYFNQLDPIARAHLSAILGVPQEPGFYEVLDIKAEEYMAQYTAFEAIANRFDFDKQDILRKGSKKAVLILTLSGSLIQLSEPYGTRDARRYLYQNIYGNAHPPEGNLVLDRNIRLGHRVHSIELTTSPVRALRVVGRKMSWKAQSKTFEKISRTLSSLTTQSRSQIAAGEWSIIPRTGFNKQRTTSAAERVFVQEYSQSLQKFEELRIHFSQSEEEEGRQVEAELLTLCHYLQTGAREFGFESCSINELKEFTTQGDHVFRIDSTHPNRITYIPRGVGPEIVLVEVSVGRQSVTHRAPIAFIGQEGGLVEVTPPVVKFERR